MHRAVSRQHPCRGVTNARGRSASARTRIDAITRSQPRTHIHIYMLQSIFELLSMHSRACVRACAHGCIVRLSRVWIDFAHRARRSTPSRPAASRTPPTDCTAHRPHARLHHAAAHVLRTVLRSICNARDRPPRSLPHQRGARAGDGVCREHPGDAPRHLVDVPHQGLLLPRHHGGPVAPSPRASIRIGRSRPQGGHCSCCAPCAHSLQHYGGTKLPRGRAWKLSFNTM
jgi:hypothetical protein